MAKITIEGRIVNYDMSFDGRVVIDQDSGLIESVEILNAAPASSDVAPADDTLIFPGFGDLHVHAREDAGGTQSYKETFRTASEAAVNGGVAFFAEMPNNPVAPTTDERYREKEKLAATSLVPVVLYGGIGPSTKSLSFKVPYKAFMGPSVGDLFFTSAAQLEEVIAKYRGENISFHCEDPEILHEHEGEPTHELRRPPEAEITAVDFALGLIEKYDLTGKICHASTLAGIQKIVAAKRRGVNVTCEITPHHLYFDSGAESKEHLHWLQVNPAIRNSPEDRKALIEMLRAGDIDYLATDHAPHTIEEKEKGVSGMPHLDTFGPFATWLMKEHNFAPEDIARICAQNPGRFLQPFLDPQQYGKGFGVIAPGYYGSLTIIQPNTPVTITRAMLKTKCGWSPFEGITFPGRVKTTIVGGKAYDVV